MAAVGGPGRAGMQAVDRVAAVLEALAESGGGQSLSALAARTGLPKTTVHRICSALERVGYVRVDAATGRRGLGPALLRLATIGRRDLRSLLEPYLERLSRDLNETVDLAVLDDLQVLFIAQHPAPQRELMAIARVGAHFPAYTMASGRVLLAQLPPDELRRRLPARLEPAPGGRRVLRRELLRELEDVRAGGLGYEREEMRPGICAVAVAVRDADGRAASIAVPMPAARFHENEEAVAAALLRLRDEIQRELGNA
ncbi:MAG: IclR family transcriptional regulator [Actinomycetes bacterium]